MTFSCEHFWFLMRESRHGGHSQIGPARLRRRGRAPRHPAGQTAEAAASVSGRRVVALRDGRRFALVNPG
ncbi:hypothetical protein [Streptomyces phaeoluteigriseus]|uniref:hypothetical protein n=1 Tax=Streptomyces phaeoluteigriseus TaxID=114686 RepID=UPI00368E1E76